MPNCLVCGRKLTTRLLGRWLPGRGFLCGECVVCPCKRFNQEKEIHGVHDTMSTICRKFRNPGEKLRRGTCIVGQGVRDKHNRYMTLGIQGGRHG